MISPLSKCDWLELDEVESTQLFAAKDLIEGASVGVVFAWEQTKGRGRFDRQWVSRRGDSLTMSLIFLDYADHPKPHLVGMALAIAAAAELHCQIRWPNDLILNKRKMGGILTEILPDQDGRRVPVVGIGINLNQASLPPEISRKATSFHMEHGATYDPREVAHRIIDRLKELPEPTSWASLAPIWSLFDDTPGKLYKLTDGREAVALGVGPEGELLCSVDGESQTVLAADAIFGP